MFRPDSNINRRNQQTLNLNFVARNSAVGEEDNAAGEGAPGRGHAVSTADDMDVDVVGGAQVAGGEEDNAVCGNGQGHIDVVGSSSTSSSSGASAAASTGAAAGVVTPVIEAQQRGSLHMHFLVWHVHVV